MQHLHAWNAREKEGGQNAATICVGAHRLLDSSLCML